MVLKQPSSTTLATEAVSRLPLRVLIAEDDQLLAELLQMSLEALGCSVLTAADGREALELLETSEVEVLISDWMMPRLDGLELVRAVRVRREGYLHVIMMTARGEERSIRDALQAGADDFLYKPFDAIQIELGIASARRVVSLQRRLEERNRSLAEAHRQTEEAYGQIKKDLVAAAKLQQRLLPVPSCEGGLRTAIVFRPSLDIGGDSLGTRRLGNGRLLFFNIDVAGHGLPAALNSFAMHNRLIQLGPRTPAELAEVAALLNREMAGQEGDAYATLVAGLAEADASRVSLLRAGHPPPFLLRRHGTITTLAPPGFPLGFFEDSSYSVEEVALEPGDRLVVHSDGVTDCGLGESELRTFCSLQSCGDPQRFVDAIDHKIAELNGGQAPDDDISLLLIERDHTE